MFAPFKYLGDGSHLSGARHKGRVPHETWKAKLNNMAKRKRDIGRAHAGTKRVKQAVVAKRRTFKPSRSIDIHYVDIPDTSLTFSTTLGSQLLNGIIPGDDVFNRTGRHVQLNRLQLRGRINFFQDGTTPLVDYLRMLVIYDRQANGAISTWAAVIQSVQNEGTSTSTSVGFPNESNRSRFLILSDKSWKTPSYTIGAATGAEHAGQRDQMFNTQEFMIDRNLKGLETAYNSGTAGTIADISSGAVYVFVQGLNVSTAAQWRLQFTSRLYFKP